MLLAAIDSQAERDVLWETTCDAIRQVTTEVDALTRCDPAVRNLLYGYGVLGQYCAWRDELTELLGAIDALPPATAP